VIRATITVETEGQKRIMIGEKGRAIRDLGQRAREEVEKQIGRPVFMELTVKVHPRWRKDTKFLKDLENHPE
jgi:GTP-binding protein Era